MKTTDKEAWNDWKADSEPRPCGGLAEQRRNLIAAAPDLLAACKTALEFAEWTGHSGRHVAEALRAAIARAEGRQ